MDFEFDELKREFLAEAEEKVQEIQVKASSERTPETLEIGRASCRERVLASV